jgi:ribonuclease R
MAKRKKGNLGQMILQVFREIPQQSLNYKQISSKLSISNKSSRKLVAQSLDKLVKQGKLIEEERGKYRMAHKTRHLSGTIDFIRSGAAYVTVQGLSEDIFVPAHDVGEALQGDEVQIILKSAKSKKLKGKVTEVINRAEHHITGTIEIFANFAFLKPDNPKYRGDFYIPLDRTLGAMDGEKVVARFQAWPPEVDSPIAYVEDVIGTPGEQEAEMMAALAGAGFPLRFPQKVIQEADRLREEAKDNWDGREDFREVTTFTIDPVDAKDFDDAISFRRNSDDSVEVGVHIADVTHYMKPSSALEEEAQKRATSVYLVDRVVPMLPEVLSNELCSLRPQEEKACFSCIFTMRGAEIIDYRIARTVIYSDHRFAYEDVQKILEGEEGVYADELRSLNAIAKDLRHKRLKAGAIAFYKTEVRFQLDENKKPIGVLLKVQKDAHKLIEEFMLLANRTVAAHIGNPKKGEPRIFPYRVHDKPDFEKLADFFKFIGKFGYEVRVKSTKDLPRAINELLDLIRGKPEEEVISMMAIRSMAKAYYSTENIGHFGLSFPYYVHFTSPIRRYPDVLVHRLLARYLKGEQAGMNPDELEALCEHSSEQERKAAEAERASVKFFQVLFVQDSIGKEFEGIVSGVTEWGIFVEMVENKCEGMVRLRDMQGDYFFYDDEAFCVRGHNTGQEYHLGQKVTVRIESADLISKQIDLSLLASKVTLDDK